MRTLPALLLVALAAGCADPAAPDAAAPDAPGLDAAGPAVEAPSTDRDTVTAGMAAGSALREGDRAPDFALPDPSGETVRLSDRLAQGPVVLTFYRGAWCPYCNTQLRDYQQALDRIRAAGASLVAVSPQTPDGSLSMREKNSLEFAVLSDVGGEVSRDYGLVFEVDRRTRERYEAVGIALDEVNGTDAWELPVPATYVIRPDGTIAFAFVEADYTQRASARRVLEALAEVAGPPPA